MIVPASVRRRWERDQDDLAAIERVVWQTLSAYCSRNNGFAVTGRRKDIKSLAEKLETGRYRSWSELDDLYACKIIVPTLAEEPETVRFLQRAFETKRITWRGLTEKYPDVFRFDSTRYYGKLRDTKGIDGDGGRLMFEVQVVTAFEHAWQTTTHALGYKSGELDWRTKRVAAQLRASVEQLDMLALGASKVADLLTSSQCRELDEQREILTGFKEMFSAGLFPEELKPEKWSRFAENVHCLLGPRRRSIPGESPPVTPGALIRACSDKAVSFDESSFPRLLSLHQFVLGCGLESGLLSFPIGRYMPLLTEEFWQVFPHVDNATDGFDLEENRPSVAMPDDL